MSANITASIVGQDSPSLDDVAERIRDAHAGVIAAFSNAIDRAIDAGETLIIAKKSKLIPHGQWGKFLTRCGVRERQAERYMRLLVSYPASSTKPKKRCLGLAEKFTSAAAYWCVRCCCRQFRRTTTGI